MAVEFSQESVLRFVISNGGKVRNADLLTHYRRFLREHEERERNRELFKRFVNSVATVRQEDGASVVVLRRKYRQLLGDVAENLEQDCVTSQTQVEILPAAGIVTGTSKHNNNNDFTPSLEKVQTRTTPAIAISTCDVTPDLDGRSGASGRSVEQPCEAKATREAPGLERDVCPGKQRQSREADGPFVKPAPYYEVTAPGKPDTSDACERVPKRAGGPSAVTAGQAQISTSTPCLLTAPLYARSGLSRSNDSLLRPQPQNLQACRPQILASSCDSLSTTSDTGWSQGRDEWSSDDGSRRQESDARRDQEARLSSGPPAGPLHRSAGHLGDGASSPESRRGAVVRRFDSRLRSRMCRSLGENLDQPFPDEAASARHSRLQLLSSTLSMGNLVSAPSRELSSPAGSTLDVSFGSKHSSVPLEPKEHDWFVKAASGTWTDIYALFREDPGLLCKRDFVSGFTILHWIAKHGDHRVLNTLSYGVEKAGMTLDVDAKTLCGYTPLHLAAIHGHKKLIRLLVQKFNADVRTRDSSGKRPWQYLSKDENRDILEILGAPQKMIGAAPALLSLGEKLPMRPADAKINVKRHSSIAALFKHKSHLRVSSASEAF